jgi:hypothetical protein
MPDGTVRTYLAVSGKPAYLAEIDTFTGKVQRMIPLYVPDSLSTEQPPDTGAQGAWGVSVDSRDTVFVSSYGFGHGYRLPCRAQAIEDLGRPSPRTSCGSPDKYPRPPPSAGACRSNRRHAS